MFMVVAGAPSQLMSAGSVIAHVGTNSVCPGFSLTTMVWLMMFHQKRRGLEIYWITGGIVIEKARHRFKQFSWDLPLLWPLACYLN